MGTNYQMVHCDYFVGNIAGPKGFILKDILIGTVLYLF